MKVMLLASCFMLLLPSCQFRVPKDPYTLIYPIPADPDSLNPMTSTDHTQMTLNRNIYERLIKLDKATGEPTPSLAKSWDVSSNHLVYTFHLRNDVHWQDGVKFTSDDVVYSYKAIIEPKVGAVEARADMRTVEKVTALDENTVRFTFKELDYKAIIFAGYMPILPKHIYDTNIDFAANSANRAPVGTGPFKFKSWVTGRKIELERNENYWGEKPEIKKIVFKIINDSNSAFQMLKKGELDIGSMRPIQWVRQSSSKKFNANFNKFEYYLPICSFVGWNLTNPLFKDKRVRNALTQLVNREGVRDKLYFGKAKVLTSCLNINSPEYDSSIEPLPYDPVSAKLLLADAGWVDKDGDGFVKKDGAPFKFTLLLPGSDANMARIAAILREDFMKAGIVMEIEQMEWAAFLKKIDERQFDAIVLGWVNSPNSDNYQIWHSSQIEGGSNYISFANDEVDSLLIKARREFNDELRNEMNHRIHRILHEEQPYTFMFAPKPLVAVNKRFENVRAYPRGLDILEWKVKKTE